MGKTIIIALRYEESSWKQTWDCISKCGCPVIIADRNGMGNMAQAFNKAYQENEVVIYKYDYIWFVTNIVFNSDILPKMEQELDNSFCSAIHPSFESDHLFCRKDGSDIAKIVPFVEFTAPLIRRSLFDKFPLDERMPYWGHDLDWGYRINQASYKIAVHHGCEIQHTYIRNNESQEDITLMRKKNRKLWDKHTTQVIIEKYGENWREKLQYHGR